MTLGEYYFSWLMLRASRYHERLVAGRKRTLLQNAQGRILEIGPGTGINLQYFPPQAPWTGFEPNRVLAHDIQVPSNGRLLQENYHSGTGPYDTALSTLVLCSVSNPSEVLAGIHSDLRAGGKLIFIEHVAAPQGTRLRRQQDRWLPIWRCCGGGCHPNRQTEVLIEQAGFEIDSIERFDLPLWLASPHIAGIAVKR